jgi:hypothetical protein
MKVYSPSIIEELDVSGSATITGSLDVTGIISASSFSGSVSLSQTSSYVELINVDGLATYTSSINSKIGFLEGESGSIRVDFTNYTSSTNNRLLSLYTDKVLGSGNYRLVVPVGTYLWAI